MPTVLTSVALSPSHKETETALQQWTTPNDSMSKQQCLVQVEEKEVNVIISKADGKEQTALKGLYVLGI